jgi:CHRD domain
MVGRKLCVLLVAGLVVSAGCDDDEGPEPERFEATLTGEAEQDTPVDTDATGRATFEVGATSVSFEIEAEDLNQAFAAHIHGPATTETNAGILVTLFSQAQPGLDIADGTLSAGTFPSSTFSINPNVTLDSVLVLMRNGMAYVNVHTVANPGGHIRGQISSTN